MCSADYSSPVVAVFVVFISVAVVDVGVSIFVD